MKKIVYIFTALLIYTPLYSKIAVIPYRSASVNGKSVKYERVLCTAIKVMKNTEVLAPDETETWLRETGLSPESSVSREDLNIMGNRYGLDHILTGTIKYSGGLYTSENVLYSVNTRRVISRKIFRGPNILNLASREIYETLSGTNSQTDEASGMADIAFIIDMSYNMRLHWKRVRDSIIQISSLLSESYGLNTRIYILPYSESKSVESTDVFINSTNSLKTKLERLMPAGGEGFKNFSSQLNYALTGIKWRTGAAKKIVLINNSSMRKFTFPEAAGFKAVKKNIKIYTVNGSRNPEGRENTARLAELTGGRNTDIVCYQKVFGPEGRPYHLYLERGRLFYSMSLLTEWADGIGRRKPGGGPEEIFISDRRPDPSKIWNFFSESRNLQIIQKNEITDNVPRIFHRIFSSGREAPESPEGKAMVSSGNISLWVRVRDRETMESFESCRKKGFYCRTAFRILASSRNIYGIEAVPVKTGIESIYIADESRAEFRDIIKNRDYYIKNGTGIPPLWFINIRVEKTERFRNKKDIRDTE